MRGCSTPSRTHFITQSFGWIKEHVHGSINLVLLRAMAKSKKSIENINLLKVSLMQSSLPSSLSLSRSLFLDKHRMLSRPHSGEAILTPKALYTEILQDGNYLVERKKLLRVRAGIKKHDTRVPR